MKMIQLAKITLITLCLLCEPSLAEVYRWIDEDGKTHFSDKKPEEKIDSLNDISEEYNYAEKFAVTIIPHGYEMYDTRNKTTVAVRKIYEILTKELKLKLDFSEYKLHVYDSQQELTQEHYGKRVTSENSTGFYRPTNKSAYVWKNTSFPKMLKVVTHEATHALLNSGYRYIPPWLNEGLSEYFELMKVYGMAVNIPVNQGWLRVYNKHRQQQKALNLHDYLLLNHKQWHEYNRDDDIAYAQGWVTVHFLMSNRDGRKTISHLFSILEKPKFSESELVETIEQQYPGGVQRLQTNLYQWLNTKNHQMHRY